MQVWRQTPQGGVSLLQVCIWTSGLLQSPFPNYHHLCLQAGSPSEPHGGWHDCQQTAPRVVLEHQPLLRCPGMAPLATAPVTGWRQFHPTCRNSDKYRIPHSWYTVDGYHQKTNTVYEFQGCFWHGCPVCYSNRTESHHHLDDRCFDDVYRCMQVKLDLLCNQGFRVVEIWECQWEKLKRECEDVCAFVDALNLSAPVNPRDLFFRGRTSDMTLSQGRRD